MAKNADNLTDKQIRFVAAYLETLNAAEAARRAGYPEKSARANGYNLLQLPQVQKVIEAKRKEIAERTDVTLEKIVKEYACIAFANIADFVYWDQDTVTLKPSDELTREDTAAIIEVIQTTSSDGSKNVRFKLGDKKGSLDSLGRYRGMFDGKHGPEDFNYIAWLKKLADQSNTDEQNKEPSTE